MTLLHRLAILACVAVAAVSAHGHDTWLAPTQYVAAKPADMILTLSSGMAFPKLDHAIKPERLATAKQRTASGVTSDLRERSEAAHALELRARAADRVSTYWTVLHPRPSEIKPEQVREYVEHLGIADPRAAIAAWEQGGRPALKYRYIKYAKSFVRAGDTAEPRSWSAVGMQLELVPESDPTRVTAGASIRFLLLSEGKPLARYPVALVHESGTKTFVTDAEGRVTVGIEGSGPQMLRATTLVDSAAPDARWDVHFTTVTFFAATR